MIERGESTEGHLSSGQLGPLGQTLCEYKPIDHRQTEWNGGGHIGLAVGRDIDGVVRAETETGFEPVRQGLPYCKVEQPLTWPVGGQDDHVAKRAIADPRDQIRIAVECR